MLDLDDRHYMKASSAMFLHENAGQLEEVHWHIAHDHSCPVAPPLANVLLSMASCPEPHWCLTEQEGHDQSIYASSHLQVSLLPLPPCSCLSYGLNTLCHDVCFSRQFIFCVALLAAFGNKTGSHWRWRLLANSASAGMRDK